MLQYMLSCR